MDHNYIRNRITELRVRHDISEYQLSLELGMNKGYIQSITSGKALPSMHCFLEICSYFEITPADFFDGSEHSMLVRKLSKQLEDLSKEDLEIVADLITRLRKDTK